MCKARQHSDQMVCDACGLCWDMNDPDPPECAVASKVSADILKTVVMESLLTEAIVLLQILSDSNTYRIRECFNGDEVCDRMGALIRKYQECIL